MIFQPLRKSFSILFTAFPDTLRAFRLLQAWQRRALLRCGSDQGCPLYPKSGHRNSVVGCPLCAKSGHQGTDDWDVQNFSSLSWMTTRPERFRVKAIELFIAAQKTRDPEPKRLIFRVVVPDVETCDFMAGTASTLKFLRKQGDWRSFGLVPATNMLTAPQRRFCFPNSPQRQKVWVTACKSRMRADGRVVLNNLSEQ